ncbi:MAG: PHA/PHB synthase family protein [Burkholderiales bacterium]
MTFYAEASAAFAALNRKLVEQALAPLAAGGLDAGGIFGSLVASVAADAAPWLDIQNRYYRGQLELWSKLAAAAGAAGAEAATAPPLSDRRFRAPEWQEPYFNTLARSYLLTASWMNELVANARLEPHARKKAVFFAQQMIDALSPANFPWSNPEALKLAAETRGESLSRGLHNLARDLAKGLVSTTDESAFEVGRNLATTAGAVIFENDFIQLIQYRPATATVYERPLLMVPPCINKYYILDLQPENSFVRFALEQGHTVFMVSWRNMPAAMGHATWDDYLEHGVIRAIETAAEICGGGKINVLGFCVGGTLLAAALAVLRERGCEPAASLTLLATMLDFSDTGALSVFVDEAYVRKCEQRFAAGGVLHGRELALTFASLRANDLIWNYVVNNYLKGRTPEPFDLLYWNSDSTNLPGAMYNYYVRNMYLENSLRVPGKLSMCGVPVDLGSIHVPAYTLAAREDHIVPWETAYASAQLLGGATQFVLAASGHIAGIINPPSHNRRHHWLNATLESEAGQWLAHAACCAGSWWPHWGAWLAQHSGGQVAARAAMGGGRFPEIEAAPGRYVRQKADDLI